MAILNDTSRHYYSDLNSDYYDEEKQIRPKRAKGPSYWVEQLSLSTSPAWDEVKAHLNIRWRGSDSLRSLCDEADFVRLRLANISSALLNGETQEKAALYCLEQIKDDDITEDLRIAFAKLLPHSLSLATRSRELTTDIQILLTQHPPLCKGLPLVTMKAISDYLGSPPTPSILSQKPKMAGRANVSPAPQRAPGTVPNSSTKTTISQQPFTTLTSSTARRTAQKSSRPLSTTNSKYRIPSQKDPTISRLPLKFSIPTQLLPTPRTPPSSARTQPLPSTSQKTLTVSRTPELEHNSSQPTTIPEPMFSTTEGPSSASGATLGPSRPSESLTSARAPLDSSQRRRGKNRKGRWK